MSALPATKLFSARFFDYVNFEVDPLGLPRVTHGHERSEGDPKYIFFFVNTYQGTFVGEIL